MPRRTIGAARSSNSLLVPGIFGMNKWLSRERLGNLGDSPSTLIKRRLHGSASEVGTENQAYVPIYQSNLGIAGMQVDPIVHSPILIKMYLSDSMSHQDRNL